ncbi:MAG TPA: hypothetical protein VF343_00465 [Syntrophales bacterium]
MAASLIAVPTVLAAQTPAKEKAVPATTHPAQKYFLKMAVETAVVE